MNSEHAALIALLRSRPKNLTWQKLTQEVLHTGSARSLWSHHYPDGLIPSDETASALAAAEADLDEWNREGLNFLSVVDSEFPRRLLEVTDAPPFLFTQGRLRVDDLGIAVVGSRKASTRGVQIATAIAKYAVSEGYTVVSGLAEGIDAVAHGAALAEGGRTVAFIATGINKSYPATNRELQTAIADRGLVMSQFWPDAPPQKQNFLKRNALISAYSLAAIVVEAGENSGARNLARHAVEQGRPLILTDFVLHANDWAKALVDRPAVHVVAGLGDIRSVVEHIRSEADTTDHAAESADE